MSRVAAYVRFYGVAVYIADEICKVFICFDGLAFKAALKYVTAFFVVNIVPFGECCFEPVHKFTNKSLFRFFDGKMDVVWHQAITVHFHIMFYFLLFKYGKKYVFVSVCKKDLLPIVASEHYMINAC